MNLKKWISSIIVCAAALSVFGQARIIGLGGNAYIEDPSRVFVNPAKLTLYSNSVYGESASRFYGTTELGGINIGLIFPKDAVHDYFYSKNNAGTPGADNLHLAMSMGSIGVEIFSEARSSVNKTETTITAANTTSETDNSQSVRSIDAVFGMDADALELSIGAGYIMESVFSSGAGFTRELKGSGIDVRPDISLSLSKALGLYLNGSFSTFGSEQVTNVTNSTLAPGVTDGSTTFQSYMNGVANVGVFSEIGLTSMTNLFLLGGTGINYEKEKFDTPDSSITRLSFVLPELRAGVEHDVGKVWKIEKVLLRAGANKTTTTPTSASVTYTNSTTSGSFKNRGTSTPGASAWTLGCGIRHGNLLFDACVAPGTLDGVYFLNAGGPVFTNITLSYKFKGGSSSSYSSESTSTYSPSSSLSNEMESESSSSIDSESIEESDLSSDSGF